MRDFNVFIYPQQFDLFPASYRSSFYASRIISIVLAGFVSLYCIVKERFLNYPLL